MELWPAHYTSQKRLLCLITATGGAAMLGVLSLDVAIILTSSACIILVVLTDSESTTLGTLATSV